MGRNMKKMLAVFFSFLMVITSIPANTTIALAQGMDWQEDSWAEEVPEVYMEESYEEAYEESYEEPYEEPYEEVYEESPIDTEVYEEETDEGSEAEPDLYEEESQSSEDDGSEEFTETEETVSEAEDVSDEQTDEDAAAEEESQAEEVEAEIELNKEPIIGSASNEGVTVHVNAPAGTFVEGTTVVITPVQKAIAESYAEDLAEELAEDTVSDEDTEEETEYEAVVFDITFYDPEGNVVQPEEGMSVDVSFVVDVDTEFVENEGELKVYHFADEGAELLESSEYMDAEGNMNLSVDAESFSPYGVLKASKKSTEIYYGHGINRNTYRFPLTVYDNGEEIIAYCFNAAKAYPSRSYPGAQGNKYYKITDASDEDMRSYSANNASRDDIFKTIYNGYPYNGNGIQEKYNLTNDEFRCVTQAAIWHFTDGKHLGSPRDESSALYDLMHLAPNSYNVVGTVRWYGNDNENMTKAYKELIGESGSLAAYPSNFKLDLFETSDRAMSFS